MTDKQWEVFSQFKTDFKAQVEKWSRMAPELAQLQKQAAEKAKTPLYPFETPVVYNTDYDKITKEDDIHLIVIGDNPGKDEQLAKNNRYLVGQAGKIAEGFFKRNPQLGTDFRRNVIIVNKTPVHSAKTAQLRTMMKDGGQKIIDLITESQLWMAERTAKLHQDLCSAAVYGAAGANVEAGANVTAGTTSAGAGANVEAGANVAAGVSGGTVQPELWLVGYAELKGKGFFIPYRDELLRCYKEQLSASQSAAAAATAPAGSGAAPVVEAAPAGSGAAPVVGAASLAAAWEKVYVFQHFSMNRFSIDLKEYQEKQGKAPVINLDVIHELGKLHRTEIFGE